MIEIIDGQEYEVTVTPGGSVIRSLKSQQVDVGTYIPRSVTMRQARRALFAAGLYDSVDATIAAIEDPTTRKAAQIEWEYSQEVHRDKDLVQMLAPALGLDDAALDQLFLTAATL